MPCLLLQYEGVLQMIEVIPPPVMPIGFKFFFISAIPVYAVGCTWTSDELPRRVNVIWKERSWIWAS